MEKTQPEGIAADGGPLADAKPSVNIAPDGRASKLASLKETALRACAQRMKSQGLTGKLRDDAAKHFISGVAAAADGVGLDLSSLSLDVEGGGYLAVLEALATD